MSRDVHMTKHRDNGDRLSDIARAELSITARAFFAPVVGALNVARALISETSSHPTPPASPRSDKKTAA